MPDFITVLAPLDGRPMAKRLFRGEDGSLQSEVSDPHVKLFSGTELPVPDLSGLVAVLERVSQYPSMYVVRGKIAPGVDRASMRRTHAGDSPTLAPASHSWLLLDVDVFREDLAPGVFASDPAHWAGEARAALPPHFSGSSCWWQATGSAGVKPGVRVRLAFWLEQPLTDLEAKTLCQALPLKVDLSLYTPSQPRPRRRGRPPRAEP